MSALLMDGRISTTKYESNHRRNRILKSRENIKFKFNKSLKKKLKKYKLRKDGQEDPDIIDVSQCLINSLRIKSPNNQYLKSCRVSEENRPHNYLTKMVRLKKTLTVIESTQPNVQKCDREVIDDSISMLPTVDQDKKQTDAFKLLMESRNKSIGSNSPGKEKSEEDEVGQDKTEYKELRAKRILSLNKMAQAKGSLKKLQIEAFREENVKRKMEDRAKKFKHMIVGVAGKNEKRDELNPCIDKVVQRSCNPKKTDVIESKDTLEIRTPIFKTFNLFKDMKVNPNCNGKKISKEDEEFLNKLSPSLRKKENMLCYFQRVNKDSDTLLDDGPTSSQNEDLNVIKVKLKTVEKAKKIKNKHITHNATKLKVDHKHDTEIMNQKSQCSIHNANHNNKKRKLSEKSELEYKEIINNDVNDTISCPNDNRPKRNTKKPVKYADDLQLISSDEELHIFTPKKKKKDKLGCESTLNQIVNNNEQINVENLNIIEKLPVVKQKNSKDIRRKLRKNENDKNVRPKKETKLAPIFVSKPLIDSTDVEAKKKFLQSGVPSQLKKTSTHQTNILASDEFHKVVHIQHLNDVKIPIIGGNFNVINTSYFEEINLKDEIDLFKKLLQVPILQNCSMPKFPKSVDNYLQEIKQTFPKFPVYRTYHLLKGKSKGDFKDCNYPDLDNSVEIFNNMADINIVQPDKLNWADKYKPITQKQVIGNFESIRDLKRWLVTWTENNAKSKNSKGNLDIYQSDTDSRDEMKNENNLLIITGKVGTGKTLSVYAVAAELAIKVIEVNASTKRTGKIMLQDLHEATQSHKVDRGKNSTECSQKHELFSSNNSLMVAKKRGRKRKVKVVSEKRDVITRKESTELTVSQENIRTGMSLILIDDADIVFDQDDGFCYAISQLIQSSKRPVILVTSSLSCPHLQKFLSLAKIIKMRPFLPRMLGTWLDIMCLVDNNMCSPGLGAKILDLFKGDIRRSINYLQFYMTSHQQMSKTDNTGLIQDEEDSKVKADDENSCMSWGDKEGWGDKNNWSSDSSDICKYVIDKESQLLNFLRPLNNFHFWWNLPNILNYSCDQKLEQNLKIDKIKEIKELNQIASVLDDMSITDYLSSMNEEPNITSGPWQCFEMDSVIDNENFATYNKSDDCVNEISWDLMMKSIAKAQRDIDPENKTEMNYPSMSMQRERDRVVSCHKTLTNCLNPSTILDRQALALDYWSTCRSICRTEKNKTSNNNKRNNRFCHYLKSLNIVCRNEYFESLGESLSFKK